MSNNKIILVKKKHFTFRLELDLFDALELEATQKSLTPIMMSQITKNYLLRDKFFQELGFLPMGKDFVETWLDRIDDKDIKEDAKLLGLRIGGEYLAYFFHKIDLNSLIKFLELWLCTQGKLQKKEYQGTYYYTIHHDVNQKYSLFLEGFLFSIIENILKTKVVLIGNTSNLISFTFEVK